MVKRSLLTDPLGKLASYGNGLFLYGMAQPKEVTAPQRYTGRKKTTAVGTARYHRCPHLLVNLLGRHSPPEHHGASQVPAVAGVGGAHHVLGVEALLGQLGDRQGAVLLRAAAGEGREADHEEVEAGERHHVDRQLPEVAVELAGEAERAGGPADGRRHQVVQVAVGRGCELERAEADVVQRLVVEPGTAGIAATRIGRDGEGARDEQRMFASHATPASAPIATASKPSQ